MASTRSRARSDGLRGGEGWHEREQLRQWIQQVRGRGACRHPDGAAGFATSALEVFAHEAEQHLRGRCEGKRRVLPVPAVA